MLLDKDTSNAFRSWFAFAAIIAGAFVFMALLNPPSKQAYNPQKAYASGEISADMFVPPPNVDPAKKGNQESTEKQIEEWRANRSDLAAQWETADMAHLAFRMGILGVILLGWTIFETRNAANSASQTLSIAQDSLDETKLNSMRELRAYVSCYVVAKNFNDTGRIPTIAIRFINQGVTPAINIGCHIKGMGADEFVDCRISLPPNESHEIDWPFEQHKLTASNRQAGWSEFFEIEFSYSDIFFAYRWVKAEFSVTNESFPMTKSLKTNVGRAGGSITSVANPSHIKERKIQFSAYTDDIQQEADNHEGNDATT